MLCVCFRNRVAPFCGIQVNVFPLGMAKFSGTHKDQRGKAEGAAHDQGAFVCVYRSEYPGNFLGFSHSGEVCAFDRGERTFQVASRITFSPPGGNCIAENLSAVAQCAVGGFQGSPLFDMSNHFQQLRGSNVGLGNNRARGRCRVPVGG